MRSKTDREGKDHEKEDKSKAVIAAVNRPRVFIGVDEIPEKQKPQSEKYLGLLTDIPRGKALVVDPAELGVKPGTLKEMVKRYIKRGKLPETYKTTLRTANGKITAYVSNAASLSN